MEIGLQLSYVNNITFKIKNKKPLKKSRNYRVKLKWKTWKTLTYFLRFIKNLNNRVVNLALRNKLKIIYYIQNLCKLNFNK